jgi:predicted GNAT superfamily acetyltransferase
MVIRDACADDYGAIVALNEREVQQTSAMDLQRLHELARMSCCLKVAGIGGRVAAFLLAMREGAPYQNDNYGWFAAQFPQFVYVDRIVVGADFAGQKVGSRLYQDLFEYARTNGVKVITCEYNIDPPNPASKRFHDKFGFKELGRQRVAGGSKLVSLQVAVV